MTLPVSTTHPTRSRPVGRGTRGSAGGPGPAPMRPPAAPIGRHFTMSLDLRRFAPDRPGVR